MYVLYKFKLRELSTIFTICGLLFSKINDSMYLNVPFLRVHLRYSVNN